MSFIKRYTKIFCLILLPIVIGLSIYFLVDGYNIGSRQYLYPHLRNSASAIKSLVFLYLLLILAVVFLVLAFFAKRKIISVVGFILHIILCASFLFGAFLNPMFFDFESRTEDLNNYLQTDSNKLNEELPKFFPSKEIIEQCADSGVVTTYEYWLHYPLYSEYSEYSTVLKMDYTKNPALFENHVNSIISKSEYEVSTNGDITTIIIKNKDELIASEQENILYKITIDSKTLDITYSAQKGAFFCSDNF